MYNIVIIRFIMNTQQETSNPFIGDKTLKYTIVPMTITSSNKKIYLKRDFKKNIGIIAISR